MAGSTNWRAENRPYSLADTSARGQVLAISSRRPAAHSSLLARMPCSSSTICCSGSPTGAASGTRSSNAGLIRANRPSGSDADSRCTRSPWVAPGSDTVRPVGKVSMSVLSCAVTRSSSVPRCCTTSGTARPDDMIRIHSIRSELTNAEPRSRSCSRNPRTHGSTRANQKASGSHQRRCRLTSMPRFRLANSTIRVTSQGHCGLRSSAAASRACT